MVWWGTTCVIGVYLPPSLSLAQFEAKLGEVEEAVRSGLPGPVLVMSDFNSKSRSWGCPSEDRRGEALRDWAGSLELTLLNIGSVATCVRPQGESIVDLTWASPAALRMMRGWRVAAELETLSDHRYIELSLVVQRPPTGPDMREERRWSLTKLNLDLLMASMQALLWVWGRTSWRGKERVWRSWRRGFAVLSGEPATPRCQGPGGCGRRSAYWWTEEIAQLRDASVRARRRLQRCLRRRDRSEACIERAQEECRDARHSLGAAIGRSKRAWEELLASLNEDPWERPYRMVLRKLRPWVPPTMETLPPDFLGEVVETLFPGRAASAVPFSISSRMPE
ncbi:uncharacterized protein LOC112637230 [Camponotus floridanus]|uniref:uncharacterized protein LOC112637230 n=1 Tax=Camponotus floridanus TaxID=104421 RepID=UPI000DC68116|nr:uncharacterized protein LOC112637230 [Camponotus floridanus]